MLRDTFTHQVDGINIHNDIQNKAISTCSTLSADAITVYYSWEFKAIRKYMYSRIISLKSCNMWETKEAVNIGENQEAELSRMAKED